MGVYKTLLIFLFWSLALPFWSVNYTMVFYTCWFHLCKPHFVVSVFTHVLVAEAQIRVKEL
jgi:hypothetical protein